VIHGTSHHQGRKRWANARHFRKIKIAINDELDESLIESFPASDPPSWIALVRVGIPNRKGVRTHPKSS
jgi:hypothetical protein